MSCFWEGRRVVVTGGKGFLGRHLCRLLEKSGAIVVVADLEANDLRHPAMAHDAVRGDVVFHLAAKVGGILDNIAHPADFIHDNLIIALNVLQAAKDNGVKKVVSASSACAYPQQLAVYEEGMMWAGYPEESNGAYGVSKRVMITMAEAYRKQYDLNITTIIPTNMYGPGDCLDMKRCHVIPALIQKIHAAQLAGRDFVGMMGSGVARRDFLFVEDAAQAFLDCAERCDAPGPFNVGSGEEIPIHILARKIAGYLGFAGDLLWDHVGPDGQASRLLHIHRARSAFGFKTPTTLDRGLERTVSWFMDLKTTEQGGA